METSPELGRMGDLITPDATARSEECEAMGNINDYNKSLAALESASHATEREKEPTCTHAEREMTPENGIADVQCIGVDASTDANVSGGFNAREKDGESNLTRLACEATLVDVAADVAHVEGNVSPPANVPGELSDIDVGSRKDPIQQTAEAQRDSEQYQAQANGTAKLVGQEPQQDNDISPKAKRLVYSLPQYLLKIY